MLIFRCSEMLYCNNSVDQDFWLVHPISEDLIVSIHWNDYAFLGMLIDLGRL